MPDMPPANRRPGRPKGSRNRQRAVPGSRAERLYNLSQSAPPSPAISGGASWAETDAGIPVDVPPDIPPDDRADEAAFKGYRGKYGTLKTNLVGFYGMVGLGVGLANPKDGAVIAAYAEKCADSWITLGRSNEQVMQVLNVVFGNPAMLVMAAHMPIAFAIMANHGVSPLKLFQPITLPTFNNAPGGKDAGQQGGPQEPQPPAEPAPLPYEPVGAHAPTEEKGPPPYVPPEDIRVLPDMELPSEIEVALRKAALEGRGDYATMRQAVILEIQQQLLAQNGKVYQPGALGQQVMKE